MVEEEEEQEEDLAVQQNRTDVALLGKAGPASLMHNADLETGEKVRTKKYQPRSRS